MAEKDAITAMLDGAGDLVTGLFDDLWTGFTDLLPDPGDDVL